MNLVELKVYKCPACLSELSIVNTGNGSDSHHEILECTNAHHFNVEEGIPDFTWPLELGSIDQSTRKLYDKLANEYEKFAKIPFQTFYENEESVREEMTDKLGVSERSRVLEIGGGDGRGAQHIVKRLNKGELYFQELSPSFLLKAIERLKMFKNIIKYSIANGSYLPFETNYFDAALHFGGINTFSDVRRCLQELVRVVKPGGKIVIGDEGIGPWLRETEMGKLMINSNPLIGYSAPIELIPVEARRVKVEWIMMGAFYLIEFEVAEGEPIANYHISIPSERGGTHWSRYYGNLEGITDEGKRLAHEARQRTGESMHEWLDKIVKDAAMKVLNQK
jgi:ubiquinone/menaquinone biosynthesis C-methylase UbiE